MSGATWALNMTKAIVGHTLPPRSDGTILIRFYALVKPCSCVFYHLPDLGVSHVIWARGLFQGEFKEFLSELNNQYRDVVYYSAVR